MVSSLTIKSSKTGNNKFKYQIKKCICLLHFIELNLRRKDI